MRDVHMHQTAVRFDPDLWAAVEDECGRLGVSAAQYLREAAAARLAYAAGRRGEEDYDDALVAAGAVSLGEAVQVGDHELAQIHAANVADVASENALDARAVGAQSEQVRMRAREVREQSKELRRQREEKWLQHR